MKKWTVMLIPQGTGPTRNLNLSSFHIWAPVALLIALSFTAGFLYQRQDAAAHRIARLRDAYHQLQQRQGELAESPQTPIQPQDQLSEEVRAQYEAREAAITSELTDLYELESEVRELTGLPPRDSAGVGATTNSREGKGGGGDDPVGTPHPDEVQAAHPAHIIYGMASPSADLIVQEIALRRSSLQSLVMDLKAQQDRVARTPSIWPLRISARRLSSRFGYRKDPFTHRVRFHSGLDVLGPYGTPVAATAKGICVYSGRESDFGNLVKIDHGNGVQTWYAHMSRRSVKEGEPVARGQVIGALGNTGRSTGPHLHYEVHVSGKPVNPERYLGN